MDGTAFEIINFYLKDNPCFEKFMKGELNRIDYLESILDISSSIKLNEDMLNLSARFPINHEQYVDDILLYLVNCKVLPTSSYNKQLFSEIEMSIKEIFLHNGNITYIFPEESRLIFALADILKPKRIAFMGSYYGYWAIWILPVLPANAQVWLMDINKECLKLSESNIDLISNRKDINIIYTSKDAIQEIKKLSNLDWVVLDAEGPKSGVSDPDLIDKAIYYPMIKSAFPALNKGGVMLAHNILLNNNTKSDYIKRKIDWNNKMYKKFIPYLHSNFQGFFSFETTEGVGVAIK